MATLPVIYVEPTGSGSFYVRREHESEPLAILSTQFRAIQRAKEMFPGIRPRIARVRNTLRGGGAKWRIAE